MPLIPVAGFSVSASDHSLRRDMFVSRQVYTNILQHHDMHYAARRYLGVVKYFVPLL